jgi:hypothetical protein
MRELDFSDGFTSASAPASGSATSQTLSNNVAATNVTGALLSSATYRGAIIEMEVSRVTASSERRSLITFSVQYKASATSGWYISRYDEDVMDTSAESGVTLTITLAGQVQYATDNQAGASYVGTGKWQFLRRYGV